MFDAMNQACIDAFGEEVVLAGRAVRAIYSDRLSEHKLGRSRRTADLGAPVADLDAPRLSVLAADAAGVEAGALVVVRGLSYAVVKLRPDVAGMVEITLAQNTPSGADDTWR